MQQKRRQRSYSYCLLLEAIPVLWICISEAGVRILWNIVGMLVEPLKIYEFFREVPASNNLEQMDLSLYKVLVLNFIEGTRLFQKSDEKPV